MRLLTAASACTLVLASAPMAADSPPIDANLGFGYPQVYTPIPDAVAYDRLRQTTKGW